MLHTPGGGSNDILHRNLEPYLQSHVTNDQALVTWKEGPRTGETYDSVALAECDFSTTPSIEHIEEQIVERFAEHQAKDISPDTYIPNERERVWRAVGEAITILYKAYYGTPSLGNGIELAQMFDLDGKGEAYNMFSNKIIKDGRRAYLAELGLRHDIRGLDISHGDSMTGVHMASDLCFAGDGDLAEYSSMALTHSTVTDITPAIIQMKALACDDARARANLSKMSGENKRGRASGGEYVFFWPDDSVTETQPFTKAFDPYAGLELPAVWGIKNTKPMEDAGLVIKNGHWQNEKRVAGAVPLEFYSNLWVPPMAVERHTKLLTSHGFGHIQVSPFPKLLSRRTAT
ncbi:MAG TPA: hypothetical protein VLE73_06275 [Candidatus Saccharimonadales bacterium]|nr:hypothetical protein [Candidatus Saccharimonadales bacterium]HSX30138.1 hypothetical protein [Candidatus Saccharimonadales bacterium]